MPKRVDTNHREIVTALERIGAAVQSLHTIGKGCPDLLVSYRGCNYVLELKTPKGKRNAQQLEWHNKWQADVHTVSSVEQAFAAIGVRFS